MSNCRVCGKEFVDGVGRFSDHILLEDPAITSAICCDCADHRPDAHYKRFKAASEGM